MKNRNSRFTDAMVARGWSRAEVFALVQLNRSAAQREQFRDLNPPQTAAGPSDEAAVAPEAAAPAPATSARAPPVAPSHLVGDGPTYMCLFDGCGKMYSSTDSARALPPAPHRVAPLARPAPRHARVSASTRERTASATCESGERRAARERGFSTASALRRRLTDGEPSWR